jgi:DNA-binding XRE family transcriptional regulator
LLRVIQSIRGGRHAASRGFTKFFGGARAELYVSYVRWTHEHVFVAHAPYLREKARQMRVEKKLTIDQLAERLALPRTTIYYWVKDLPIPPTPARTLAQRRAAAANSRKYRLLREEAYAQGLAEFPVLSQAPTFRDFVALYIAEGSKRNRNVVAIGNSDSAVLRVSLDWMERFTGATFDYGLQYHADQDLAALRQYWADELAIDPAFIRMQRKSNSNQLRERTWRSQYGVLTVRCNDTLFRARLQAWIDCIREQWLDSGRAGA